MKKIALFKIPGKMICGGNLGRRKNAETILYRNNNTS